VYVQMKVAGLVLDPNSKSPVVLLKDGQGEQTLPIWIGLLEAAAIAYALEGVEPARPLTHDLLKMLLEELGGRVPRVDIDNLEDDVFHAKIHLEVPGGAKRLVDCRPSDAVALALRVGAAIFAEERVLRRATSVAVGGTVEAQQSAAWKEFLDDLDPEASGKCKM
jgi:uncharacterized protein